MRKNTYIATGLSTLFLLGCASSVPKFDSEPLRFASTETLEKRAADAQVECNRDSAKPIVRIPAFLPPRAVRSGKVEFVFDLDETGTPINIRILNASEEVFVRPTLKSLKTWKYAGKFPGEAKGKRLNICSSQSFNLMDERGHILPSWTDIETNSAAYQAYKKTQ